MKKHFHQTQSRLISAKNQYKELRLDDFHSHKEKTFSEMVCKQYQQQQYQKQTMELVHRWLDYEQNAIQTKLQDNVTIIDSRLSVDPEQLNQSLYKSRQNPLSIQLVEHFHKNHSIFSKINSNLAQTLINIGTFSIYSKNTPIPYIFYEQKLKNKCNDQKRLGFLLYGRIKLYNKIQKFEKILSQQDCIGEHGIQTIDIDFSQYRNVNVKTISDETAILWIQKHHYEILFKESMKCGLKQQMKKLESLLRLNWIKKSIKKS